MEATVGLARSQAWSAIESCPGKGAQGLRAHEDQELLKEKKKNVLKYPRLALDPLRSQG